MPNVKNLFVEPEEAGRYNRYRPVYHHLPAELLFRFTGKKIPHALDVACGTGHSTQAFSLISQAIIGCDASESMLNEARQNSQIEFVCARAEELPFRASSFDYVNISMAFQWLDQAQFLKEVWKVLKPKGLLGIDNYGFTGQMLENELFFERYKTFDKRFMKAAPRNKNYPDAADARAAGFGLIQEFTYTHHVSMAQSDFVGYLMTRSNFLELTAEERASVKARLDLYYEPDFADHARQLVFRGSLKLFQLLTKQE